MDENVARTRFVSFALLTRAILTQLSLQDFERKSALFSIAVSEVLIVNIWEHQVGLYQGANMGLLKTVFEVNLALFLAAKEKGKVGGTYVLLISFVPLSLTHPLAVHKTRRSSSSSSATTSERLPSPTSKPPSLPTSTASGTVSPSPSASKTVSLPPSSTSASSLYLISSCSPTSSRARSRTSGSDSSTRAIPTTSSSPSTTSASLPTVSLST
jgi:hypothetical protein